MPSGPSHGGSHSSGGSGHHSSGGGFSFGGGGISFRPRPRRPRTMHFFGHTYIIGVGGQSRFSGILAFLIFSIFVTIVVGLIGYGSKNDIKGYEAGIAVMESDAIEYQELITKANAHEDGYYLADAIFPETPQYYFNEYNPALGIYSEIEYNYNNYYFIVYQYVNPHYIDEEGKETTKVMKGWTYSQFTYTQATGWNGKIAYAYSETDGWYSINTNYSLDKNMDYKLMLLELDNAKSSVKITTIILAVSGSLAGILLISLILTTISTLKKSKQDDSAEGKTSEGSESETTTKPAEDKTETQKLYCKYCGTRLKKDETKCPNCGSTQFTSKKDK